jgi:hypothetical protein
MNLLRSLESTIANLVEGTFGRAFRSEVRPMELARKLVREMDEHRTTSVSRVYAPNEYNVWLSPEDRARYEGMEREVIDELCAYLLEHARREQLVLASRPMIAFHTDEDLALGEFGIQARSVRPPEEPPEAHLPPVASSAPGQQRDGQTMIYSTANRLREPLQESGARRAGRPLLVLGGRRLLVAPAGAVIGRSRECDVVIEDSGISRKHAELLPTAEGWTLYDLGSTNGVRVNDELIEAPSCLRPGDRIQLGSTELTFQLR